MYSTCGTLLCTNLENDFYGDYAFQYSLFIRSL